MRISNGHYQIDGVEYMSIWTFNQKYRTRLNTRNFALMLRNKNVLSIEVPAEISKRYEKVFAFPVEQIKKYMWT